MKGKKLGRFLGVLLILLLVFSFGLRLASPNPSLELRQAENYREIGEIVSSNAIVLDLKTGEIVMGKNYNERIHPASMTKVMTAIVALENLSNLNRRVEIDQDIIDYTLKEGMSVSGFQAGDRPRLKDLFYGLLLESGGESSLALARYVAGSEEEFVSLMNEKAQELGMEDSHFSNSSGITSQENYSTAKDMALLYSYALSNSSFKKIVETEDYRARGLRGPMSKHSIENQLFYKRKVLDIDRDYIKSGKTGYTEAAGLCLVSQGSQGGRDYIVVTAHAAGNGQTEQYNISDTAKLYELLRN